MDLLEDELLDDDFSDEEESEELSEDNALDLVQDGFADWVDASDGAPEDERLEEALAEERTLELESELEQDEHPRDCLLYTSPSPRDSTSSRMPSSA